MMKYARYLCSFILLLCLALPAVAQDRSVPTEEQVTAPTQAVSVEPVARDDEIQRRIRKILEATGWYADPRVEVTDGVVFLDGTANSDDHRAWARDLASKTQDVVAVVNRIAVEPELHWTFEPAFAEIKTLSRTTVAALPLIVLALVILPIAWFAASWVSRLVRRLLTGRIASPHLRNVVARAIAVPVFLFGLYLVLQVAGLTQLAVSVIGGAGLLGIILGLAFRDIAENFLASLLLSIRSPFRGGDLINVQGQEGIVQSMNTRSTVLLSAEGNHIQIPNAAIFKSTIVNFSAAPARREMLDVGIGYDVSIAVAQQVIQAVLRDHEAVTDDPPALVLVDSLGSATVNLKVYYWFDGDTYSNIKVKSALLRLIKRALTERGISMPDEAREIIFPQGVPIVQLSGEGERQARVAATREIAAHGGDAAELAESAVDATSSEGGLGNEREEIEEQAAAAVLPESGEDLLSQKA